LHKLWRAGGPVGYHLEYGYSCMGYEIAGGLGVKMADPTRESSSWSATARYLMMNSEIATSVMLGLKLIDRGARQSRIRLHQPAATGDGGAAFNNLLA
jgi:3D-(3,5/4)-trihydroxycyclohexane-1,2-dione acylhydrolase (decyclizing)